ncbi:MarR family winged helix-turn-helix transcriptional regulator [Streptomyces scopuliridis]|uniref:MarR family winged helix-turn-helix transcriptional regulator n=1 Tax=Streptomyces scopuliridis TaxID=452529 RepID=UPI00367F9332
MTAQPPPTSTAFLLAALGRQARQDVERALRPTGYTLRHLSALGHLLREPGMSYSELGRRAGITAQSAQATVRQLEERGAVERRTDPGRGRTAELHVTATGQELLRAGRDAYAEVDAVLERVLGKQRRQDLTGLLLSALSGLSSGRG